MLSSCSRTRGVCYSQLASCLSLHTGSFTNSEFRVDWVPHLPACLAIRTSQICEFLISAFGFFYLRTPNCPGSHVCSLTRAFEFWDFLCCVRCLKDPFSDLQMTALFVCTSWIAEWSLVFCVGRLCSAICELRSILRFASSDLQPSAHPPLPTFGIRASL